MTTEYDCNGNDILDAIQEKLEALRIGTPPEDEPVFAAVYGYRSAVTFTPRCCADSISPKTCESFPQLRSP